MRGHRIVAAHPIRLSWIIGIGTTRAYHAGLPCSVTFSAMSPNPIKTVYLAGPDVFRPDANERGEALKELCARYGFEGLFPLDQSVPAEITSPAEQAHWIYRANIALIQRADAVLANLDFFRGPEPDSGTCFECGYAIALGKPVYGYLPEHGSFAERIRRQHPDAIGAGGEVDAAGWALEEFGLPLNLMLAVPAPLIVGDAEQALRRMRLDCDSRALRRDC